MFWSYSWLNTADLVYVSQLVKVAFAPDLLCIKEIAVKLIFVFSLSRKQLLKC